MLYFIYSLVVTVEINNKLFDLEIDYLSQLPNIKFTSSIPQLTVHSTVIEIEKEDFDSAVSYLNVITTPIFDINYRDQL